MPPEAQPPLTAISNKEPDSGPSPTTATRRYWHLATNQLNLMYLLAAGLITGPRGFGRKYYRDALGTFPGLIPLFAERIPSAVLAEAIAEGPHLRAVIALVDLAALRGPILAMTPDSKLRALHFPADLAGDEALLLVPAPLPAHWIRTLVFASAQHKTLTQAEAAAYANVPLADYKLQVQARLFAGDALLPWPPVLMPPSVPILDTASGPAPVSDMTPAPDFRLSSSMESAPDVGLSSSRMPESDPGLWPSPKSNQGAGLSSSTMPATVPEATSGPDPSPSHVSAVGAALALLFALGNTGAATTAAARALWALPPASPNASLNSNLNANLNTSFDASPDPILRTLLIWALQEPQAETDGVQAQLLRHLLSALVDAADSAGQCPPDPRQVVIEVLSEEAARLTEPKWREALTRLGEDLRGSITLGDATISELLQRHPRPFSRGLLLFFLRERCEELLAFRHPALADQDLVVAAALFAARWGWMALPATLRATRGLAQAAQHRMAALAHRQSATGIDLGPAPPPLLPLRALLESASPKAAQVAALRLARGMGWEAEVLNTRISLGKGDYRLTVDGRGAHLLLAGDVKAVTSEVDQAALLARLTNAEIPSRLDAELRAILDTGLGALAGSARAGRVAKVGDGDRQDDALKPAGAHARRPSASATRPQGIDD